MPGAENCAKHTEAEPKKRLLIKKCIPPTQSESVHDPGACSEMTGPSTSNITKPYCIDNILAHLFMSIYENKLHWSFFFTKPVLTVSEFFKLF